MRFCGVIVTLYDTVNMIHDVITTAKPFPYTVKFMFVGLKYVHRVAVYQKYLTRLGEMIIFSPSLENYQFSQPR